MHNTYIQHTYIHTHTQIHTYTHTHTHKPSRAPLIKSSVSRSDLHTAQPTDSRNKHPWHHRDSNPRFQ